MKVIYEPKGRAREYADLACNTYVSCPHGCVYCYAKNVMHKSAEEFHACAIPRVGAIKGFFERDCEEMARSGDKRRVHLNFISDPYPEVESKLHLTRHCIETAARHGVGINILTKGKYATVKDDLPLMKSAGVHLGVTLAFNDDDLRRAWAPNASTVFDRYRLIADAHRLGIFTWVSMEPVVFPDEALAVLDAMHDVVDLWKVGKLNYHPHAKEIDWPKFREDFTRLANSLGAKYIIKKDLLEAK